MTVWALAASVQLGKYQSNNSNSFEKNIKIHLHDFYADIYTTVVTLRYFVTFLINEDKYIEQNL